VSVFVETETTTGHLGPVVLCISGEGVVHIKAYKPY
jgi:hypothetical protein